jgi:hypothetical protein
MTGNRIHECTLCGMEADKTTGKWLHAPALSHLECPHIWCSNPVAQDRICNKNYSDIPDIVIKLIIKME